MFFSTIKKCNDDRVIKTGLDAITEFRRAGVGVIAFACCFVKGTLVISFGYDIPYPENMQTAMVMWVIERLPEEENIKKWNIILRISLMQNAENIANISGL